ncbi:MAG TPA: carboxymuconolactone decarboxylase family protein [Mycobacteriales bacterium]|nr:carboxymuconolactone decarboxylase family protein [Mycobacteriales bacterium]
MRVDYMTVFPAAREAMLGLEKAVHDSSLEPLMLELVKIRASQLNGCAHCLEMHTKDARALGESDDRMHLVAAWREAACFSDRERAALTWCESLTLLPDSGAPNASYEPVAAAFDPEELVALTLAIVAINGWNRFAVGLRAPVGNYRARRPAERPADESTPIRKGQR